MEYDAWYDPPLGHAVLQAEQQCVQELLEGAIHPWLDLGTGSGRFGAALAADIGLDPALELLRIAARRMPSVLRATAEALPFPDESLGAILSVTVFEFLPAPRLVLREIMRVLRPGGRLVVGFFPSDGAWALAYKEQGLDPDSVFHGAHFFTFAELRELAAAAGLIPGGTRSSLLEAPGRPPSIQVIDGIQPGAGFMAIALVKPDHHEGQPQ